MSSLCLPAGCSGATRHELAEFAAPSNRPSCTVRELYQAFAAVLAGSNHESLGWVELRRDELFAGGRAARRLRFMKVFAP